MRNGLRTLVRLAAISVVAGILGACSTMASLNPWGGSDTASNTDDNGYPVPASDDNTSASTLTDDGAANADNAAYPSVASVPEKPKQQATPEQRKEIASSLVADRGRAQYSADALRGGTEPAAPPPPEAASQESGSIQPSDNSLSQTAQADLAPAPAPESPVAAAPEPAPAPVPAQDTQVASLSSEAAAPAPAPAARAMPSAAPIPGAEPAIPADEPLAFKPSSAPPLDSSLSQFVPQEVLSRYEATQAEAGTVSAPSTATTKVNVAPAPPPDQALGPQSYNTPSGVTVNMDAVNNTPGVMKASARPADVAAFSSAGGKPNGVVFFAANASVINPAGLAQVKQVAESFKAKGDTGFIRVVGHAASRTGNMSLADHIALVFKQSQQNADAVAQALIKAGVPAKSLIIEAVGDTQPIYYESMPQGEDGNRRTEIFIES